MTDLPPEIKQELLSITELFGEAYAVAKDAEKEQKTHQAAFYEMADKALATRRLPRKAVEFSEVSLDELGTWVARHYPGWTWNEVDWDRGKVILQRDPSLMKYSFTNPVTKMTYQRTTTDGVPVLDEERIRKEDPDLWEQITQWPEPIYSIVKDLIESFTGMPEHESIESFLQKRPEIKRQLKPSEAWSNVQAAHLQKYMIPGAVKTKLVPPRAATQDELDEAESNE